jgi:hypothetical protein
MAENIDADFLISLIEARPVLWDKTLDVFKDRIATRNAWLEVCVALKPTLGPTQPPVKWVPGLSRG